VASSFLDERDLWPNGDFVTAHIIVSTKFLQEHPELVKAWLRAHVEVTQWELANPDQAKQVANDEIKRLTGKALLKLGDNITTDHISPAGAFLKLRSNVPEYAKAVFHIFNEPGKPTFAERAMAAKAAAFKASSSAVRATGRAAAASTPRCARCTWASGRFWSRPSSGCTRPI
jgi:aconitase A